VPEIAVFVCSFIKRGSPSIPPTVAVLCPYRFPLHGFFAFTVKGQVEYDFGDMQESVERWCERVSRESYEDI